MFDFLIYMPLKGNSNLPNLSIIDLQYTGKEIQNYLMVRGVIDTVTPLVSGVIVTAHEWSAV
jgi:hypothetical protein